MNIAIVSYHGCPVARLGEKDTGGMNVYVLNMAKELSKLGNNVDVFTRRHDITDPQIVPLSENSRVIHIPAGLISEKKHNLHEYIDDFVEGVLDYSKSNSYIYDYIHSHYWLSGLVAGKLSDIWNIPHTVTFHTLAKTKVRARTGEEEGIIRSESELGIMASATGILVLTEAERLDINRLYKIPLDKIKVIPGGVNTETFYPEDKITSREQINIPNKLTLLYAGRIEPIKGLDILVDSFNAIQENLDAQLIIVGGSLDGDDVELKRLKTYVEKLGILNKVRFVGSVPQEELRYYYSAADIFVFPSHYESFGLVALESMACGTPVVASRVGGIPSFINDAETGYLIPMRCPEPYIDKLEILLSNQDLRENMGDAALSKAKIMNWETTALRLMDYYEGLLSKFHMMKAG